MPRPRLHLIRFGVRITSLREVSGPPLREHGVWAPNAKLRALVVPQEPERPARAAPPLRDPLSIETLRLKAADQTEPGFVRVKAASALREISL